MPSSPQPQTADPLPPARTAWAATAILTAIFALAYVDRQVLAILAEPIKLDLGLSDSEIGLIIGFAFFVSYSLAAIPLGQLVDRMSRRRVIGCGVAAWSVLTAASGMAGSFWQLLGARALVGVGEASIVPAGASLIGDYFPPHRRMRASTVFMFGGTCGAALAYMLGGVLLKAFEPLDGVPLPLIGARKPWQLVFLTLGALGVLFVLLSLFIREPRRASRGEEPAAGGAGGMKEIAGYLFGEARGLLAIIASLGCMLLMAFGLIAWLPALFARRFGWPPDKTGAVVGAIALFTAILGMVLSNVITERFAKRDPADAIPRTALWFCGLSAIPMIGSTLLPKGEWVAIALFPALTCMMGFAPLAQGAIQVSVPSRMRGRVNGVYVLVTSLFSAALGPSVVPLFTDFVFRDEMKLHYSLAATGVVGIPLAFGLVLYARRRFADLVRKAEV
jgi:MFS family permease